MKKVATETRLDLGYFRIYNSMDDRAETEGEQLARSGMFNVCVG